MHYKSSFNALIMPCNAAYNALYNLTNKCNYNNTYQFNTNVITLCIWNSVIIILDKI